MANNDWMFWALVIVGGFLVGLILEQHLHLIENICGSLLGAAPRETANTLATDLGYGSCAKETGAVSAVAQSPKKFYPNPLYDPRSEWETSDDDSWYYLY